MGTAKLELPPLKMRLRGIVIHAKVPAACECGGALVPDNPEVQHPEIPPQIPHVVYHCVECQREQYVKPAATGG